MTAPRFAECKCGHARNAHPEQYEEACAVPNCVCAEYIPATLSRLEDRPLVVESSPVARAADADRDDEDGVAALLAEGRRSSVKRTANLAVRIGEMVEDLRARLDADRETEKARRRVTDLERQLAAARAALKGSPSQAGDQPPLSHPCTREGCERLFASSKARGLHERRAHDGFNPHAARGAA